MIIIKFILIFILAVMFKFLINFYKHLRIKKIKEIYLKWLENEQSVPEIHTYLPETTKLLKDARVNDRCFPISQPAGYGTIANITLSLYANFFQKTDLVIPEAIEMFDEAIGCYRTRWQEAFNPIYWIELVLFLPKKVLEYIGVDLDKISSRIINLVFTAIWWLTTTLGIYFKTEILNFLKLLIEKFS